MNFLTAVCLVRVSALNAIRSDPSALDFDDGSDWNKNPGRRSWLTFRRTYSSWSHDKDVPGKVTAQPMGHANLDTTLNVYTQVLDGSVREAAEKVGGELFTIVHKPGGAAGGDR